MSHALKMNKNISAHTPIVFQKKKKWKTSTKRNKNVQKLEQAIKITRKNQKYSKKKKNSFSYKISTFR